MKKAIIVLFCISVAAACGNSTDSKNGDKKDANAGDSASVTTPAVANEKGLELIGASDCTTCHSLTEKKIGPAYSDVAEKYRNTPHALDTLIKKVISGGSGHWGTVPMTGHPALPEADVREMITYILSMKK